MPLQSEIIQQLLKRPMSLADLAHSTTASLPTIRRAVQALTEARWIEIIGQAEANGGRPAMLYGINEDHYMIFGLELQLPGLQLLVSTLSGSIFERIDLFQGEIPDPNLALRVVVDSIHEIANRYPHRQALGIGVAAPGFIDLNSGDIIAIGRVPSFKNFPICRHLRESTRLPVQIANDVDCMAIAEFHDNYERLKKNLVYVGFCEGVKASLFLNGELYKSSNGNAGLIDPGLLKSEGYLKPQLRNRLLTTSGFNDVFDQLVGDLAPDDKAAYQDISSLKDENERFKAIIERAATEDPICYAMSADMISLLSTAIANIVLTVQPDEVIIGGLLGALPKRLFRQFESAVRGQIPALISNNLMIKQGTMAYNNNAAIGAIYHFLESKLTEILSEF